jgi:hypothetical protein
MFDLIARVLARKGSGVSERADPGSRRIQLALVRHHSGTSSTSEQPGAGVALHSNGSWQASGGILPLDITLQVTVRPAGHHWLGKIRANYHWQTWTQP